MMRSGERPDLSKPRVRRDADALVSTPSVPAAVTLPDGKVRCPGFPSTVQTLCSGRGGLPAPSEVGAVRPHAVQDPRTAAFSLRSIEGNHPARNAACWS